jgi:hypothetical protein
MQKNNFTFEEKVKKPKIKGGLMCMSSHERFVATVNTS